MKPIDSTPESFILWFEEIDLEDISRVGGKNASLGEMYRELTPHGVKIPNGFAITAEAYRLCFVRPDSTPKSNRSWATWIPAICLTSANEGDKSDKRLLAQTFLQHWNRP